MKFFIDTEFMDDGKTLELISIGIACENGWTYYAESSEYDESKLSDWVKLNVVDRLKGNPKPLAQIRHEIIKWIDKCVGYGKPEFWCYFGAWDWLLFCRTVSRDGTLMKLPSNYPNLYFELVQHATTGGCASLLYSIDNYGKHNALADALWTKEVFEAVDKYIKLKQIASTSKSMSGIDASFDTSMPDPLEY